MSQVMDADIFNASPLADPLPEFLDLFAIGSRDFAADNPWVLWLLFEVFKEIKGRGAEMDNPCAGL